MVTKEEFKGIWETIKKESDEMEHHREELEDKEKLEKLYITNRKPIRFLCRRYRLRRDEMVKVLEELGIPLKRVNTVRCKEQSSGYVTIFLGDGSSQLEHRYIWEQTYGPIPKGWVIHHINGVKSDNRRENLIALSRHKHPKIIYTGHGVHNGVTVVSDFTKILQERIRDLEKVNTNLHSLIDYYEAL